MYFISSVVQTVPTTLLYQPDHPCIKKYLYKHIFKAILRVLYLFLENVKNYTGYKKLEKYCSKKTVDQFITYRKE